MIDIRKIKTEKMSSEFGRGHAFDVADLAGTLTLVNKLPIRGR